jgi:hypothetical protein
MTDRVRTLTVVLDRDMRDDDVQHVVEAVQMIRFVGSVELGEPVGVEDHIAREAVRHDLQMGLLNHIRDFFDRGRGKP